MKNQKKIVLSKFLEEFYNDRAQNAQKLLFIPYKLYEEKCLNKNDFVEAFNQSFDIIWEDVGDNPKLIEYLATIFNAFVKKNVCKYDEFKINEDIASENEEFLEVYQSFLMNSLSLLTNSKEDKASKISLQKMMRSS